MITVLDVTRWPDGTAVVTFEKDGKRGVGLSQVNVPDDQWAAHIAAWYARQRKESA